jgi:hypothetical protein
MSDLQQSNRPKIAVALAASFAQAAFLYAALLTLGGILPMPAELSIVFAVFGIACFAGAIFAGSGISVSFASDAKKTKEPAPTLVLPPLLQPPPAASEAEQTAFGETEFIFGGGSAPEKTSLLATEYARQPKLRLTWSEGGKEKSLEAPQFPIFIGRDASVCAVDINDNSVSRRHAKISLNGGVFSVSDEGSSNGTTVDGSRVVGDVELYTGQSVKFGRVSVRIEILD